MGQTWRHGIYDRFLLFVVITMALSVLCTVAISVIAMLALGKVDVALNSLAAGLIGAGALFGPMLIIGLIPSVLVFASVYHLAGREKGRPASAEYAGVATAGIMTVLWVVTLSLLNGDGPETILATVGIPAVLIAPFVARRVYSYKDISPDFVKTASQS